MKSCDLCGAESDEAAQCCVRCGFDFPKVIMSDIRDEAILKKYEGKSLEEVKRELKIKQTRLRTYLENMDTNSLKKEELVALLEESLGFLRVPVVLGVDDELNFSQQEEGFIMLLQRIQKKADIENGGPISTSATYVKMANALQSLELLDMSMDMITKALLINPNNQDALFAKSKFLFYAKDYSAAKRCLEKLIEKGEHPNASYLAELINQLKK